MNKKGDEIVEAAMVLPILILTILSLILLIVYYFSCLNAQVDLHRQMVKDAMYSETVFEIQNKTKETSSEIGGVISMIMSKKLEGKIYMINEADIIRAGEVVQWVRE